MNCASKSQTFKTWNKNNITVFAGQVFFVYQLFSLCWGRKKYTCQDSSESLHLILKNIQNNTWQIKPTGILFHNLQLLWNPLLYCSFILT